jgi:cyclin-dependent kinase
MAYISDRFKKYERIGNGTYAVVFRARDIPTKRIIALKKYKNTDSNQGVHTTILREIAILKMIYHPNIVDMVWYDNIGFKCLYMPLYKSDLKRYYKLYNKLEILKIRDIIYQISRGLYHLHSHGIAHRDIKPQNILVHERDNRLGVVLIDMGLAKRLDIVDPRTPKTYEVCTTWYRPPELMLGYQNYHFEVDIWSLGCIIAEIMISEPLFPGDSDIDQLYKIFRLLGTPNDQVWPGVSNLPDYKDMFPQWTCKFSDKFTAETYNPDLVDLLKATIVLNPTDRLQIHQILTHPFLKVYNFVRKTIHYIIRCLLKERMC